METMTALKTLDQAIADRLVYLEEVERQREIARQEAERKAAAAKLEFATALAERLAADYGVAIDPAVLAKYAEKEPNAYGEGFVTKLYLPTIRAHDKIVVGSLHMNKYVSVATVCKGKSIEWSAARVWTAAMPDNPNYEPDPSAYDDEVEWRVLDRHTTEDFMEAIVFAKTGRY